MAEIRGGTMVQEILKKEGVKYIFGIPGGHIYPMMESCDENGIKFIGVRHEMTAAMMAEGWALTTGDFGVCTATAGPGVTNLVTGIANADRNCSPVLIMAGKAKVIEADRNELQDFNQIDIYKSMTKHARSVQETHRIPEYVGRGIAEATTGRPGPVYMEIPRDIMEGYVDESLVEYQKTYRLTNKPAGNPADIEKAAKILDEAQRPVVIAGSGAFYSKAQDELKEFVEKTGIPFFTRNAARGLVPDSHPLFVSIGATGHPVFAGAIQNADVVLLLGTRPGYIMKRESFPANAKIIRVDIDAASITDQLDVEVGIAGDVKEVLKQLISAVKQNTHKEWTDALSNGKSQMVQAVLPMLTSDQTPIHPVRLMFEIMQRIDEDTIVVIDGGDTATFGNSFLPATGPGQYMGIANGSFGPLGVGVPYAMAAKLAHPEKKVLLITGDGAFGYGAMEYDTALRYGIKFTTVILNDSCWGMIKRSEAKRAVEDKPFVGLFLRDVRYDKVVEALGGYGEYVTEAKDIGAAIDRAMASDKPAVVNVMTDVNCGPNR
ncbi:MAG TPA: thiamine pyrophosphate-binding protein [Syntrophomonadaceae bacterium]|nr:thiamine pyrophosphate-binding protein [Syntrophomonadaceae bacterium]HRX20519.1 thiamine pyrophosphate-binding protein [Syntrophomonadaceae bacterium]